MTREEALQRIVDNNFAGEYGFDLQILIDCMVVAREMMLNSQFQIEDCIRRQQAIDKMQELEDEDIKAYGCEIPEGFDGKRAIEALNTLPSIQPKTGYWIEDLSEYDSGYPKHIQALWKCSECKKKQIIKSKYCPNCGNPKMQEVEENGDK